MPLAAAADWKRQLALSKAGLLCQFELPLRGEGRIMAEERKFLKNCPVCGKEVPAHWSVCEFCGNVFRKEEHALEAPSMLSWSKDVAEKKE